ncbi:MAG: hypothetical protein QM764_23895 [Chitinophagaceae bacterium]
MDELLKNGFIPIQHMGKQTEVVDTRIMVDEDAAIKLFITAKEKLLQVNQWHLLCGFLSPAFQLSDSSGNIAEKFPDVGDYIRINIPGPGTKAGRGYDWVKIERLTHIHIDNHQELFFMQVRPASYPKANDEAIAHFFKNTATSSFMIVRELSQITAAIYGRNEVANTETENEIDNIRNAVIANSGAIGLSTMQWKSLVSALVND